MMENLKMNSKKYSVYVDGRKVAGTDCTGTAIFIAITSNGYERKVIDNNRNKEIYFCYGDDIESPFEEYFCS